MASVIIRNLPDDVKAELRIRAAQNGRSLEAELRHALGQLVLAPAVKPEPSATYSAMLPDADGLIWPDGPSGLPLFALAQPMADQSCTYRREDEYDAGDRA